MRLPILSGLIVLALALTLPSAHADRVGVSAAVVGSVSINGAAGAGGRNMFLGDRVVSGDASGMQILLLDQSTFTIGERVTMTINRFVYDPDTGAGEVAAEATQGFLRYVAGRIAGAGGSATIETPSGTIGVRGSTVDIVIGQAAIDLAIASGAIGPGDPVDPATAIFLVIRGPSGGFGGVTQRGNVDVTTSSGSTSLRTAGFGSFIGSAGAAPLPSFAVPQSVQNQMISSVEPVTVGSGESVEPVTGVTLSAPDPFQREAGNEPGGGNTGFDMPASNELPPLPPIIGVPPVTLPDPCASAHPPKYCDPQSSSSSEDDD